MSVYLNSPHRVLQLPIITNKVSLSHKGEGGRQRRFKVKARVVAWCLGMGATGDWIGLNWGSDWRDGQGRREGDWLAMLDAKGFPFGESYGETTVLPSTAVMAMAMTGA